MMRFLLSITCLAPALLPAQAPEPARDWAALVGNRYTLERDIVYKVAGNVPVRVDVYRPLNDKSPRPTVLYIHGGGWRTGGKEQYLLFFLPYIQMGMTVVSVQYRLADVALAPAAVEDCRCALRWLVRNASRYGFDTSRLLITGGSAGGHLALLTGMLEPSAGFDNECPGDEPLKATAILNYYGPVDLVDALEKRSSSVVRWFGGALEPQALARLLSPMTYVRSGLPAILTIHGDADATVAYQPAVRFHQALDRHQVPNQLVTVPGGQHGRHTWPEAEMLRVHGHIEGFLKKHQVLR